MSLLAKVAWAAMWSRAKISEKNNWISEEGVVCFFYSYKNLMEDLGIGSTATIYRVKQELIGFQLLKEWRLNGRKTLYAIILPEEYEKKENSFQVFLNDHISDSYTSDKAVNQSCVIDVEGHSKKVYDLLMRILKDKQKSTMVYEALLEAHRYLEKRYKCIIPFDDSSFELRQVAGYTAIRYKSASPSPLDVASYKDYWYQSFVTELENQGIDKFTKKDESSRQKQQR